VTPRDAGIDGVFVREADAFRRAGIDLLDRAMALLRRDNLRLTLLPQGRGLARLLNLTHWSAAARREWVDGEDVCADQVIHFATHRLCDERLGSADPRAALFAECVASAMDLYLCGKLARAGEETEFLTETLESYGYYYEIYAGAEGDFERLLTAMQGSPWAAAKALADYLYAVAAPLLTADTGGETALAELTPMTDDHRWPLVHHYHVANWVLFIRAHGDAVSTDFNPAEGWRILAQAPFFWGIAEA